MQVDWITLALLGAVLLTIMAVVFARSRRLNRLRSALGFSSNDALERVARETSAALEKVEARERASRGDLAQLADELESAIVRLNDAGLVITANRAAGRLLGVRTEALIGRSAISAFVDHRIEILTDTARERGSASGELAVTGATDRTVMVRASRAASGGTWLIIDDITELRHLQRIRREFIDNLSHELRTPLTTIRLLTEILTRDLETAQVPDRTRDRLAKLDVETGHLVQMVNELLDLSRIEGGVAELHLETVDLKRVVNGAIERLATFADRQGVHLKSRIDDASELPFLSGDEERLGQLLINLLHNAIKFTPAGKSVMVDAQAHEDEVVTSVSDEGVGIPRAELERIFERFYKVDKARVRGAGGTGLGLSIARHIVESHGGRIWAESEEGGGSTFCFAIPIAEAALQRPPDQALP